MNLTLALDYSNATAFIAIFESETGIKKAQASQVFKQREAGLLQSFVGEFLTQNNLRTNAFSTFIVGVGPGSFTTLRLASATILGLAAPHAHAKVLGVPSALGIVWQCQAKEGEEITVLYDGRNGEALYFSMEKRNQKWKSNGHNGVIKLTDLNSKNGRFMALKSDESLFTAYRTEIEYVESICLEAFIHATEHVAVNELIYLREAVFTQPIVLRKDLPL